LQVLAQIFHLVVELELALAQFFEFDLLSMERFGLQLLIRGFCRQLVV
jgi:hypothetical protein